MDELLELECRLSEAQTALDRARRLADDLNELQLAREFARWRDLIHVRRLRVADRVTCQEAA